MDWIKEMVETGSTHSVEMEQRKRKESHDGDRKCWRHPILETKERTEGWGLSPHMGGLGAQAAMHCGERSRLEIIGKAFGPEHSMDKVKIEGVSSSWW